jgi:hypothetical protein
MKYLTGLREVKRKWYFYKSFKFFEVVEDPPKTYIGVLKNLQVNVYI